MQDSRTVAVVGFNTTEQLVLGSIFGLAAKRVPRFVRHGDSTSPPDLFLVDADDAGAVSELLRRNADRRLPVVLVGATDHGTGWPVLARPLQWAKVIVAFDHALRVPEPAPAPVKPAAPAPLRRTAKRVEKDTILVVSSDRAFRALAYSRLSLHAVDVEEAPDANAALERLAAGHCPCVIVDADSRGAESLRLCKAIKSRKGGQPTAVIVASSGTAQFDRVRATMAGCDAYLTKPLSDERLDEAIHRYVAVAAAF